MNSPAKIQPTNLVRGTDPQPLTPDPLSPSPHWRTDFPINWEEDHYITRREFTSFLTFVSGLLFLATSLVGVREWWRRRHPLRPSAVRIAQVRDVPIGGVKMFHYPTANDPCLLIRLAADHFVAYSQKCTHLSCPVVYHTASQELRCPCIHGRFAIANGQVLAGPPQRP
ncbi:MAG: Rieske (2Fe-2S) protein, partial [Deltaproteobacteria bacterium]|nr:Rieske (2Fe-2S) protein [Deltaproteobacteria bacterium]